MLNLMIVALAAFLIFPMQTPADEYPIKPFPFTDVRFEDSFWLPRLETNRKETIPYDFKKCEETGRIRNFAKAGGLIDGKFEGIYYNDSDVFKVVEGASYSLLLNPDPKLEKYLDDLIAKFAAAQEDDGYLYTNRTIDPSNTATAAGKKRWCNIRSSHELYNVGHMYEAAVAHYRATGKKTFLDVAIKNADLVCSVFGPGKKCEAPGHQEIEIGLSKLYLATGDQKYLDMAVFFLDMRGRKDKREIYGPYCQDHLPVVDQSEPVGHAVRAGYMYSGMADVAALTGNIDYIKAVDLIWENMSASRLYLTGGIGARHGGEAFGDAYELPNATAYNETCAAIANAMWNHRLFLLHGDSKYLDILERVIYNGFLSGVSLTGDSFFYVNPLSSKGNHSRSPWFSCSCCPTNVVRFLPSLPGYVYASRDENLYVCLYIGSSANIDVNGCEVKVVQETNYPWDGDVSIALTPEKQVKFRLQLRFPGWAINQPAPGGLYRYMNKSKEIPTILVNGVEVAYASQDGFASINRTWKAGDKVKLILPMKIRRVLCNDKVKDNIGRTALERGPLVYCIEGVDNEDCTSNIFLPDDSKTEFEFKKDLMCGTGVIRCAGKAVFLDEGSKTKKVEDRTLTAIPYHLWAHRGKGDMNVWLPRDESRASPKPQPTVASMSMVSASHCFSTDSLSAVNDQIEPKNSIDHDIPRLTWWDHRGTIEWLQYDFKEPVSISSVEVYWFDDRSRGACRVPDSWRILFKKDGRWISVRHLTPYTQERDCYNKVTFAAVDTNAIRVEVSLKPKFSGGILEMRVDENTK